MRISGKIVAVPQHGHVRNMVMFANMVSPMASNLLAMASNMLSPMVAGLRRLL